MVKKYQTKKKNKHNDKLDKKYKEIYQKNIMKRNKKTNINIWIFCSKICLSNS